MAKYCPALSRSLLFDGDQFIFLRPQPDLLRMGQTGLILGIGRGILKMVVMVAEATARHLLRQLGVGQRGLPQAGICAGLIQRQRIRGSKHPDIRKDRHVISRMTVADR